MEFETLGEAVRSRRVAVQNSGPPAFPGFDMKNTSIQIALLITEK